MFQKIDKHMKKQKENPAEQFKPSAEDKFPTLTQQYWANPNDQKGTIETCSYHAGIKEKSRRMEGV